VGNEGGSKTGAALTVVNTDVGSEVGGKIAVCELILSAAVIGYRTLRTSNPSDDEGGSVKDEVELGSSKDEVYALDKYPAVKSLLDDTHLSRAPRHKHNAQDPHDGMNLHFWGRGGQGWRRDSRGSTNRLM
jgi:hypothetical protein